MRIENVYQELCARITAISSKVRECMKEFDILKRTTTEDNRAVFKKLQNEIDSRIF
jgi:hypothetical protein